MIFKKNDHIKEKLSPPIQFFIYDSNHFVYQSNAQNCFRESVNFSLFSENKKIKSTRLLNDQITSIIYYAKDSCLKAKVQQYLCEL